MKTPRTLEAFFLILICSLAVFTAGCTYLNHDENYDQKHEETIFEIKDDTKQTDLHSLSSEQLRFDPKVVKGALDNGFKYILLENTTPEHRVSMHLDVLAGSMNETEKQRGIAHFLEHMLFNGSTHFKPGELVEYFQSIGMRFGPDANAHTSFYETVYDVFLPSGDRENLEQGLLVMDDYAGGALLLPSEVEKERGVVLSEKKNRDSVSYRTFKKKLAFELPGSRIISRFPIGLEEVIKKADSQTFKTFYNTWYRPDNMILVMVGDFDAALAEELIKKRFSSMQPRAHKKEMPGDGFESHAGVKCFYHYEAEAGATEVSINTVLPVEFKEDTLTAFKERAVSRFANRIFQNRLSKIVRKKSPPFTSAAVYSGEYLRYFKFSALGAETSPDKWETTLTVLEKNLRQALEYGFTPKELSRVKADFILDLDKSAQQASTRKSSDISRRIMHQVNRKRVFQSPEQKRDILKPLIQSLTLDEVNRAFADTWSADHRLIEVTGNAFIHSDKSASEKEILSVFKQSEQSKVEKYQTETEKNFPYLPLPAQKGRIISFKKVKDLGIEQVVFDNQVGLNLKKTDFQKGRFFFRVDFGSGKKSEPLSREGISFLAKRVINESGLGAMDKDQLDAALAGRNVNIKFNISQDGFSFSGSAGTNESELVFHLVRACFLDTGFRQKALSLARERYRKMYTQLERTQDGMMQLKGDRFLAGGDTRFGMPEWSSVERITLQDIKSWIKPVFDNSGLEISIAGDFNPDEVLSAAQELMGTLPGRRSEMSELNERPDPFFPAGRTLELTADTRIDKAIARLAFPTDDFWDIHQTRRLNILAAVFSERMRKQIREKLGAAYSPYAYNHPSRSYDGYGVFNAVVPAVPENIETAVKEMENIAASLADSGVDKKELNLALLPVRNHIRDLKETNDYWLNSVLSRCQIHDEKLKWARDISEDYASITIKDMHKLAEKYFKKGKKALVVVKPL